MAQDFHVELGESRFWEPVKDARPEDKDHNIVCIDSRLYGNECRTVNDYRHWFVPLCGE